MPKKFFVHMGYDKTGTTSVQEVSMKISGKLLEFDILYPVDVLKRYNMLHPWFLASYVSDNPKQFHVNIATGRSRKTIGQIQKEDEKWVRMLEDEIKINTAEKVFISFEGFITMTKTEHKRLYNWCKKFADEVVAIIYVRDPVSFHESSFSQRIKTGRIVNNYIYQDIKNDLKKISSIYGKKNVIVRPFDAAMLYRGDVVKDIYSIIVGDNSVLGSLEREIENIKLIDKNASLQIEKLYILRELINIERKYNVKKEVGYINRFWRRYNKIILKEFVGSKYKLNSCEVRELLNIDAVKENLEYLKSAYGIEFNVKRKDDIWRGFHDILSENGFYKYISEIIYELMPVIECPSGKITVISKGIPKIVHKEEKFKLTINIENNDDVDWWTSKYIPLMGGIRWKNEQGIVKEQRFEIPGGKILSRKNVTIDIDITPPKQEGDYQMIISLVQEQLAWFEDNGDMFHPAKLKIKVIA